ncbi:hypothetical protein BB561_005384 [Smittium simulii]|uniref:FACT complex subunit POB3 n=1 Tax=Smittium simulii TaxID=133385 RepID=A0A2T9YAL4_9FUNG|nr:hypothetical protein BB561_005384 [Smittium simulii]
MSEPRISFKNIYLATDPYVFARGEVRLGASGIGWKPETEQDALTIKALNLISVSSDTGLLAIQTAELARLSWHRAARGYGIRISMKNGNVHKLDGFERDNLEELKSSVNKYFSGLTFEQKDTSVENKLMFDIPMENVSNTNLAGKTEVSIEIQPAKLVSGFKRKAIADELVEVRFYVPGTVSKDADSKNKNDSGDSDNNSDDQNPTEQEMSAAQVFYETVKSKADIGQITDKSIVTFNEILCLTPRGRYTIDMFKNFLRLRGKTYDYKILYEHILKLFLVTKPDNMHVLFIMYLSPPIRQGQTRYPYLVFQFLKDQEKDVSLNLSQSDLSESITEKLQKSYDQPLYKTITELFTVLSKKRLDIPDNYQTVHGSSGVKCSLKANEGLLYPLVHGLLFVPKPAQFIDYSEISSIIFSRVGSGSVSSARTFDLVVHTHSTQDTQFSSISREEYNNLLGYLKENGIKVISDSPAKKVATDFGSSGSDSDTGSHRGPTNGSASNPGHGSDDDEEEEDDDFVAQSESDIGEEFDEDYNSDVDEQPE